MTPDVVREFEGKVVVVENVSFANLRLSEPAGSAATDRVFVAHNPTDLVDTVNSLLDQSAATKPAIVIPIADLPLDVADTVIAEGRVHVGFGMVRVVGRIHAGDVTDHSFLHDFLEGSAAAGGVAPAEPGQDCDGFSFRHLKRFVDVSDTGSVNSHRLFGENVFSRFHSSPQVEGAEAGSRGGGVGQGGAGWGLVAVAVAFQLFNSSTFQHFNISTFQHLNISTFQHFIFVDVSTFQHVSTCPHFNFPL